MRSVQNATPRSLNTSSAVSSMFRFLDDLACIILIPSTISIYSYLGSYYPKNHKNLTETIEGALYILIIDFLTE